MKVNAKATPHWVLRAECEESDAVRPAYVRVYLWEMVASFVRLVMLKPEALLNSQLKIHLVHERCTSAILHGANCKPSRYMMKHSAYSIDKCEEHTQLTSAGRFTTAENKLLPGLSSAGDALSSEEVTAVATAGPADVALES